MQGNMMPSQLLISGLIEHAETTHPDAEIVSRRCEGDIHRYTYRDAAMRSRQLASALQGLGILEGDRIATLAWNNYRHFELYYGVSGMGAVLHTVNPRLFSDQLEFIINHAQDRWIFVDLTFVPLLESIQHKISGVEGFVIMTDPQHMPETTLENVLCYETLIANGDEGFEWPMLDENQAASLCYTSGTTGNPKGVLYSHRSTIIHAQAEIGQEALGISNTCCMLPVVPMFHVNAWGVPYSAAITGAKLVFPGPGLDGKSLWEMIEVEQPDLLLGVPTVWLMLLDHMEHIGQQLTSVENVVIGGAAAPLSMIKKFHYDHDAFVVHAWGMTEMSPVGTVNAHTPAMEKMPLEQRFALQQKQGRPIYGVEMKIVDDQNNELEKDGKVFGKLLVRGPWIVNQYYRDNDRSNFIDGWFDTGDVATIDPQNYLHIVDRSKDVIKSGGEWISSIDLENTAVGHPDLQECCVIGVAHDKWTERPLLLAVKHSDAQVTEQQVLDYLNDKVAKWWIPDAVVFVEELPHTATGKLLKTGLRYEYQNYLLDGDSCQFDEVEKSLEVEPV
ncbi:long-chain-fatty-acid--CoA ligase [Pelagibaculum spongiae]|uniref:Long-chain fatty acid--CoA ligase n=1 Tax=Pelagibaculum spongiae TaxID=2080658 RepID=A0A2V1H1G6_9GAMM|nr:long-chain-fatty-acid--CoA ligase [Pelagibaculum spongiae]PVZ68410.1 long-chain fatty acid--CoA ligase [Pelagibaculum spongiae]